MSRISHIEHEEKAPNSTNNSEYREYLEAINSELEKIKTKYADPLDGVLKYDENWRCTTFFWEKVPNKYLSKLLYYNASPFYVARLWNRLTKKNIEFKEKEIDDIIHQIEQIEDWLVKNEKVPWILKKVYKKSLNAMKNKFLMFKSAVWIEWEKSGYKLTDAEREKYRKQVADLQSKIYWKRVSDEKNEVNGVLNNLHTLFNENKDKLKEEYRDIFQDFLDNSDEKYWFKYKKKEIEENVCDVKSTPQEKYIDPKKMEAISKSVLNFYKNYFWEEHSDLKDWKVVEQDWVDSINISWMREELWIPSNYDNVDNDKITQVIIAHEIEQHLLQWVNTNRILGKWFSCGRYDWISEWVARINEDIASGKVNSIEDLKWLKDEASIWTISVFICENYNYDDAMKILTAYYKLSSDDSDEDCIVKAKKDVKRRKRFVPYNMPWSSVKDALYQRWKNRVIDYLTQDDIFENAIKRYKDLNTFKFGPDELKYIDEIKEKLNINEKDLIYPLFIWRILHDKLNKWKWSINEYLKYFQSENDKTWEVWLSHMKLNPEKITWATKRKLVEILLSLWYDSKKVNKKPEENKNDD